MIDIKDKVSICGINYEIKLVDGDYCGANMGKSDLQTLKFSLIRIYLKTFKKTFYFMKLCTSAIATDIYVKKMKKKEL